tara:strand:- start:578 stop:1006 length:429 start_codon:yes stop_codon:yes gene_type:complete
MINKLLVAILVSMLSLASAQAMAVDHDSNEGEGPVVPQTPDAPSAFMKLPVLTDCSSMDIVLGVISRYEEVPLADLRVFVQIPDGRILDQPGMFTANPKTGTWSIVALFPETQSACIMQNGGGMAPSTGYKPSKAIIYSGKK